MSEPNFNEWWERDQAEEHDRLVEGWLEHLEHEREQRDDRLRRDWPVLRAPTETT